MNLMGNGAQTGVTPPRPRMTMRLRRSRPQQEGDAQDRRCPKHLPRCEQVLEPDTDNAPGMMRFPSSCLLE
jgi:hypothetical protein